MLCGAFLFWNYPTTLEINFTSMHWHWFYWIGWKSRHFSNLGTLRIRYYFFIQNLFFCKHSEAAQTIFGYSELQDIGSQKIMEVRSINTNRTGWLTCIALACLLLLIWSTKISSIILTKFSLPYELDINYVTIAISILTKFS